MAPYTRNVFLRVKGIEKNQLITWNNTKTQENVSVCTWPISAASLIKTAGEMSINISFIMFLHKQLNFNVIHLK